MTLTQLNELPRNLLYRENLILSIITVVRNDEVRLAETIQSLSGIYEDERFEHIIIDGLSTDGTIDLLQGISNKSNVKIISGPDNGIYDAMNKGVGIASGRFELFLNCGDRLIADSEDIVNWCDDINPALIDIVCFPCALQFGNKKTLLMPRGHTKYKMPTSHQAMIFTKDFVMRHPYNIERRIAGDFELYLQSNKNRVYLFPGIEPISLVQGEGVASANPFLAYSEYLGIVMNKYDGVRCVTAFIMIFIKGAITIFFKSVFSKSWINFFRALS